MMISSSPRCRKDLVELLEAPLIAAGRPDKDLLPSQIVKGRNGRGTGSGDHEFADVAGGRDRKINDLLPFRGDGQGGGGDVAATLLEKRDELVADHRDGHHAQRPGAELEFLVELFFEFTDRLGGESLLGAFVEEEVGLVVDDQDSDRPILDQSREVPGKGLQHFRHQLGRRSRDGLKF